MEIPTMLFDQTSKVFGLRERFLQLPSLLSEDIYSKRLVVPILFVLVAHLYSYTVRSQGPLMKSIYFTGFTMLFLATFLEDIRLLGLLVSLVTLSFVHSKILLGWHWMPASNFGLQLVLLMVSDFYCMNAQTGEFARMVFHTVLMGLFVRTATFAYDMSDAYVIRAKDASKNLVAVKLHERDPKRLDYITLQQFPSYWEYLCYSFFPVSIMYGPHMRFVEYRKLMDLDCVKESSSQQPGRSTRMREVLIGLVKLSSFYLLAILYTPLGKDLVAEEMLQSALWYRVAIGYIALQRYLVSFYIFWYLVEYAFLTLGVGFNAASGKWDYYRNAVPEILDYSMTYGDLWVYWNIGAHKFLKDYVYKRFRLYWGVGPAGAGQFTYWISAAWHGANTGKLALFFQIALVEMCFESIEPFINHSKYWWVFFIPHRLGFAYFIMPGYMTGKNAFIMFGSWYYYGHIIAVVYFMVALVLKRMKCNHKPPLKITVNTND